MGRSRWSGILFAFVAACAVSGAAIAQPFMRAAPAPGARGGMISLPYRPMQTDAQGNNYFIYQGGWFQQQGQMPEYSEGALLMVNGNPPMMTNNMARLEDGGEIVIENMATQQQGCTVTRRVLIDRDAGWVRVIDIFKNSTNAPINVPVSYRTSLNFGITNVQSLGNGGRKSAAGAILTDGRGRGALEWFGGRGAKVAPQVAAQPNNNNATANVALTVPAGKEVALLHLHAGTATADAAQKLAAGIKESKLIASLPKEVRKLIVNVTSGNLFIGDGDIELLRGDEAFDAAEMRGGDQIHGTLREKSYKLTTFYGPIELPADKVVSLVNIGESRPRQLIVTNDGEIFGGHLDKDAIDLELSSGQVTKLPLSQITRLGYRKRPGESDDWPLDKPMVLLRTGERITVQQPTDDVTVVTRYGTLKLAPAIVASIAFQNEENGVHEIYLTDGSKFAGLVTADAFDLKLGDAVDQLVKIPTSTLLKLRLAAKGDDAAEPDANAVPTLKLANEDLLVGTVTGKYKLETTFDTLTLDGQQVKSIVHSHTSPLDVIVRLWDDTTVGGQLQEQELTCQLKSGVTIKVPVALVAEYMQPQPKPADAMTERVKQIVSQLNADDFKAREEAQRQLIGLGASIAPILKELRNDQPLEAKQRIDGVLQALKAPATTGSGAEPDN